MRAGRPWLSVLVATAVLVGLSPTSAAAGDRSTLRAGHRDVTSDLATSRAFRLERRLSDIRTRLDDAPRRALFDLDRARRRLRDLEIEAPRDPRLLRLERDLDRLETDAYRIERRRDLERSLERLRATRPRLATPSFARPPFAPGIRDD